MGNSRGLYRESQVLSRECLPLEISLIFYMVRIMNNTEPHTLTENKPVLVLVNPQMGENIGAAARAMLNCGLDRLRIVNPRDGWPSERAEAVSSGALAIMPPVEVFATVAEALADCHYVYATTARNRDLVKPVLTPNAAASDLHTRAHEGQKTAILFGAERAGLTNDELSFAHAIISIPVNPDFSSLNLAQSVLLVSYEWSRRILDAPSSHIPTGKSETATIAECDNFFSRLEEELARGRFFRIESMRPTIMNNIKSLFKRAEPTDQEINTLHGIISALTKTKGEGQE